jgi:hypothetical protein
LVYLGSKEHTALLALGILPILYFDDGLRASGRRRAWLISTTAVILVYAGIAYGFFIPRLQSTVGQSVGQINQRLSHLGATIPEIFLSPLLRPGAFWPWLASRSLDSSVYRYLAMVLVPYAVFLRRNPIWIVGASIGVFANLIPERPEQRGIHWHYDLAFAPFLIMGLLQGMRNIPRVRYWKWGVVVALALSLRWPAFDLPGRWPTSAQWSDSRALSTLSCTGVIGADDRSLAHLAHCPDLRWFKVRIECADPSLAWKSSRNHRAPNGVAGESPQDATRIVLDRSDDCLSRIASWLVENGAHLEWQSPSGRFVSISRLP